MKERMSKKLVIFAIVILMIIIIAIFKLPEIQKNYHSNGHIPAPSSNTIVVAFIADAKPALGKNIDNLVNDFNQIKPQSPGNVSAIIAIGDMNPLDTNASKDAGQISTEKAYNLSKAKNVPLFYVMGNHEMLDKDDLPFAQNKFRDYAYFPNPGPDGSKETTYSLNVGNMHIIVLNEYWDGDTDGTCNWYIPSGGLNRDDACFKYSNGDGGFIPDTLFDWLRNDLKNNTKKWIIVVGHEPLYPLERHVGDSLDENKTNRDRLENLFISNKVTAFIGGHTHFAGVSKIDNIFHANAGVFGDNKRDKDNFASIIYTYEDVKGNFELEWRYENPTWTSPGLKIFTKISNET